MRIHCSLILAAIAAFSSPAKAADLLNTSGTLSGGDPTQSGRLTRTGGAPSDWSALKTFPGSLNGGTFYHYRTFTVSPGSTRYIQVDTYDPANSFFVSAYQDTYNPGSQGANYLGDESDSGNIFGHPRFFQVVVPAGHSVVIVVNEVTPNGGIGLTFGLRVEGFSDTQFSDQASQPAALTSPINGSTLPGSSVTFQWTSGIGVTQYWLSISKLGVGGGDLYNSDPGPGLVTSKTINGLPADGSTIYVRLYSHIGSTWPWVDYTFTASGPATITSPVNGSLLPGSSVTFQWTLGTGVTQYWLSISKLGVGGGDLYNSDPGPGLVTSKTINGLPSDGSTIYVRLYSHIGSAWPSHDYVYTAAGPATITSPVNGSTLPGSSVNFQWTTGTGVTQYWLSISKAGVGGGDLYNSDPGPGLVTSKTINGLPTDGTTIYVRLYSHIGSSWPWRDYVYTAFH